MIIKNPIKNRFLKGHYTKNRGFDNFGMYILCYNYIEGFKCL